MKTLHKITLSSNLEWNEMVFGLETSQVNCPLTVSILWRIIHTLNERRHGFSAVNVLISKDTLGALRASPNSHRLDQFSFEERDGPTTLVDANGDEIVIEHL